jgi:hypothetical protein
MNPSLMAPVVAFATLAALGFALLRSRGMERWFLAYLRDIPRRSRSARLRRRGDIHLLIAIVDHFEPGHDATSAEHADARVARWVAEYPRLFARFRDSDGRPPRHTFFYPVEQYDAPRLDALAGLCLAGFGEVEIHLHHDDDTSANLRATLLDARRTLSERHGLLAVRRDNGEVAYGFVHGNWCLDNARPDGRGCGVNDEIDVLRETGCYADFTMPSAPGPCQTRTINRIYHAVDDPTRPMSHDRGVPLGEGPAPARGLLMIQGPLVLNWRSRKFGLLPRIENGCIQPGQEATIDRVDDWLRAGVSVPTRPDWVFVKLHAHGATESGQAALLGPAMVRFHEELAARMAGDPTFHVHYVTAREMYNLAKAAGDGWSGSVAPARDYELGWMGASSPIMPTPPAATAATGRSP